jgi:hypothetical protein
MIVTGSLPFPFITKEGSLDSFRTVGTSEFNSDFAYGDVITGSSYPLTSSINSDYYVSGLLINSERKRRLLSLKNTFNYYSYLSPHYAFSSSLGDKELQQLRLISIPSIFYGQSIKKRSVSCKWYLTGSLIAELQDINGDGELIQVGPSGSLGSGSVAGVVLYSEGFICLTGSWSLHPTYTDNFDIFDPDEYSYSPNWTYFLTSGSDGACTVPSSSFEIDFDGTEHVPVVTMIAKAENGEFNHSNNPTYVEYGQKVTPLTGSSFFSEQKARTIKNIVKTNYDEEEPPFEKITYISKIAIYDEEENLIGVAKLAKPIRKKENDNISFKLKLDL